MQPTAPASGRATLPGNELPANLGGHEHQQHACCGRKTAQRKCARAKNQRPQLERPIVARRVDIGRRSLGNGPERAPHHRPGVAFVTPEARGVEAIEAESGGKQREENQAIE